MDNYILCVERMRPVTLADVTPLSDCVLDEACKTANYATRAVIAEERYNRRLLQPAELRVKK